MERKYTALCYAAFPAMIPRMSFTQNDSETCKIEFELYQDIDVPMINVRDASVTIKRPDDVSIIYGLSEIIIVDNIVTFTLPVSSLSIVGQHQGVLQVYADGYERLTIAKFKYNVLGNIADEAVGENPIEVTEQYPILNDLVERVNDVIDGFAASGATGVDAEVVDARKGLVNLRAKIDAIDTSIDQTKYITDASTGYKYYAVIENGALIYRRFV